MINVERNILFQKAKTVTAPAALVCVEVLAKQGGFSFKLAVSSFYYCTYVTDKKIHSDTHVHFIVFPKHEIGYRSSTSCVRGNWRFLHSTIVLIMSRIKKTERYTCTYHRFPLWYSTAFPKPNAQLLTESSIPNQKKNSNRPQYVSSRLHLIYIFHITKIFR